MDMNMFTPAKYALLFKLDNILIGHNLHPSPSPTPTPTPATLFKMHFFSKPTLISKVQHKPPWFLLTTAIRHQFYRCKDGYLQQQKPCLRGQETRGGEVLADNVDPQCLHLLQRTASS